MIFQLLIPPFVGAVIGYFTNYVAIKMLFRPRKAYYLFGRRLPFTPGLIPSKRGRLAEAIARVVRENLLTEESVKQRLNEENVRRSIRDLVDRFFEQFMENVDFYVEQILERIGDKALIEMVEPSDFEKGMDRIVSSILRSLKEQEKSLDELLPESVKESLISLVRLSVEKAISYLEDNIDDPVFQLTVKGHIKRNLSSLFNRYVKIIPERSIDALSEKLSAVAISFLKDVAEDKNLKERIFFISYVKAEEFLKKPIKFFFSRLSREDEEKVSSAISKSLAKAFTETMSKPISQIGFFRDRLFHFFVNFLKQVGQSNRSYISDMATEKLLEVIELELPVIMQSLDIETIVRDRVNALPMEDVEEIVLKLISEELKYITLIGGILGFFIGSFQDIMFFLK